MELTRRLLAWLGLAPPPVDPGDVDRLIDAAWSLMRADPNDEVFRAAAYEAVGDIETMGGTRALLDRLADELRDAHAAHDPRWARIGDLDPVVVAHFTDRGRCADHVDPVGLWLADYAAARTRGDYRSCTRLIRQAGTALAEWTRLGLLITARTVAELEQGVDR